MTMFMLFGVKSTTLNAARSLVEKTLGIVMEEREGWYQGGIYFTFGEGDEENLILKNNIDLEGQYDGEFDLPAVSDFPQYKYLLYLDDTHEKSPILTALRNAPELFDLLRKDVV